MRSWTALAGRVRAAGLVGAIAFVVLGVAAPPAGAHSTAGLPSTDWRSRVVGVRVGDAAAPTLHARTSDLGQHLELTVPVDADVTVLGYSGEPYLWFTHGRVLENLRSPAVWLNRKKNANPADTAPAPYSASAAPLWQTVASGTSYRWHDHRVHALSRDSRSRAWNVPIQVNGQPGTIAGRLDLVAGPPLALPLLAIVVAAAGVTLLARRRPGATAVLAVIVAVIATVQLVGTWQATTATLLQRVGPSSYALAAVVAGLAIAVTASAHVNDPDNRYAEILLLGGVVLGITGGLAHIDWLTHSQLPTIWNAGAARAMLIVQLATGVGAVVAAVMLLEARVNVANEARTVRTAAASSSV